MHASRTWHARRHPPLRQASVIAGACVVAAALVQVSLKFYWGFSWIWSIVIGLSLLFAVGLLAVLVKIRRSFHLETGITWIFGDLPPLDLRSRDAPGRDLARPSGSPAMLMPQDSKEAFSVHINDQAFSLGGRFEADRLFLADFDEGGSVARVRARALPEQTMLMARHCIARSFGDFIIAPGTKGEASSPAAVDVTAFLFFALAHTAGVPEPGRLVRITIVAAGGRNVLDAVTRSFVDKASKMYGEPHMGSRSRRIWRAGGCFLVCEEEEYKDLQRSTFIWTMEDLDIPGLGIGG